MQSLTSPYGKINQRLVECRALRSIGLETSNLHSGFVGIALRQVRDRWEIVAITPGSCGNGPYFLPYRRFI